MNLRRSVVLAAAGASAAVALAGCAGQSQPVTYAPAAYGVPGHCYYVNSAAEAAALKHAGVCPASWAPTPMPLSWLEEYYAFYDSPAYYNVYVPARVRTVYVQRERTFGRTHVTVIRSRSKLATYRSSAGQVVRGTQVRSGKVRFGSGTSFSSGSGGRSGSLRTRSRTGTSGTSSRTRTSSRSGSLRSGRH